MLLEEFVAWRNLQALRVAAGRGNGERRATRTRVPKRRTTRAARTDTARRRTVH
jgi:hypothetical protein